jgi:hypothetical protein
MTQAVSFGDREGDPRRHGAARVALGHAMRSRDVCRKQRPASVGRVTDLIAGVLDSCARVFDGVVDLFTRAFGRSLALARGETQEYGGQKQYKNRIF